MALTDEDIRKIDSLVRSAVEDKIDGRMPSILDSNNSRLTTALSGDFPTKSDVRTIVREEVNRQVTDKVTPLLT